MWYQGESDIHNGAAYYACALPVMLADWRAQFALPTLPFLLVELAAYKAGDALPAMRIAQASAEKLPVYVETRPTSGRSTSTPPPPPGASTLTGRRSWGSASRWPPARRCTARR